MEGRRGVRVPSAFHVHILCLGFVTKSPVTYAPALRRANPPPSARKETRTMGTVCARGASVERGGQLRAARRGLGGGGRGQIPEPGPGGQERGWPRCTPPHPAPAERLGPGPPRPHPASHAHWERRGGRGRALRGAGAFRLSPTLVYNTRAPPRRGPDSEPSRLAQPQGGAPPAERAGAASLRSPEEPRESERREGCG